MEMKWTKVQQHSQTKEICFEAATTQSNIKAGKIFM